MIDSYEWKMPVSWGAGIFLLSFLYWALSMQFPI
jgi:hypothetical protein